MGFLSNLKAALFSKGAPTQKGFVRHDGQGLYVYVKCDRCGEVIPLRLRKTDEMAQSEEEGYDYFVQKVIVGQGCFQRMDARLEFDRRHELVNSSITGGHLVPVSEYQES